MKLKQPKCKLCSGNGGDWGNRHIHYEKNGIVETAYFCEKCGREKSDYELYKLICKGG